MLDVCNEISEGEPRALDDGAVAHSACTLAEFCFLASLYAPTIQTCTAETSET